MYVLKHPEPLSTRKRKEPDATIGVHSKYRLRPDVGPSNAVVGSPGIVVEVAYQNENFAMLNWETQLWAQSVVAARLAIGLFIEDRTGNPADPYATLAVRFPDKQKLCLIPFGAGSAVELYDPKLQRGSLVVCRAHGFDLIPGEMVQVLSDHLYTVCYVCPPLPVGRVYLDLSRKEFEEHSKKKLSGKQMQYLSKITTKLDLSRLQYSLFQYLVNDTLLGDRVCD
jgi:hypothetical protein